VNLLQTLEANLALPRGLLAGIGWADLASGRVPMPVGWADAEADTAWAGAILAGYDIGPGDHCLFVTAGRDYWPRQVETAVTALGGFIGNISPAGYENRRLSVYLRFLPPKLIVGRSPARTTSPFDGWKSEPTETPSASHSRISEATETLARSRSSLDRNPLVSPASSATSAIDLRAASRAARSWAPTRASSMKHPC